MSDIASLSRAPPQESQQQAKWKCRESGRTFSTTLGAIDYVLRLDDDEAHNIIPMHGDPKGDTYGDTLQ